MACSADVPFLIVVQVAAEHPASARKAALQDNSPVAVAPCIQRGHSPAAALPAQPVPDSALALVLAPVPDSASALAWVARPEG